MNHQFLLGLVIVLAACGSGVPSPERPSQLISIRVVDAVGEPLPEGAEVSARVAWYDVKPLFVGISPRPAEVKLTVRSDGRLLIERPESRHVAAMLTVDRAPELWLRLERAGSGGRERACVRLDSGADTVVLRPEELLARGSILDELRAPVPRWACRIDVIAVGELCGPTLRERLEPRWVHDDGRYELWGWRAQGKYVLRAWYGYHGPYAADVPLVFGGQDLDVMLPATGILQCRLNAPALFPRRAVYAVLRDTDSGLSQRRWLIPRDATNLRLPIGRYDTAIELSGVEVHAYGTLVIEHGQTTEVDVDLSAARVFCIEVVDAEGRPIPAARVRVVGSPDPPLARQRVRVGESSKSVILVATTEDGVDLEVSESKFSSRVVKDVRGDLVVELERKRAELGLPADHQSR